MTAVTLFLLIFNELFLELSDLVDLIILGVITGGIRFDIRRVYLIDNLQFLSLLSNFLDVLHEILGTFVKNIHVLLVKMLEQDLLAVLINGRNGLYNGPHAINRMFLEL